MAASGRSYWTFGSPLSTRCDSVVFATCFRQNRTQALRQLEEETRRARERLEGEARKSPDIWAAYQHWRTDGEPIGFRAWRDLEKRFNEAPEFAHLWSSYLRLTADLKHALSRPSWPGILSEDDPRRRAVRESCDRGASWRSNCPSATPRGYAPIDGPIPPPPRIRVGRHSHAPRLRGYEERGRGAIHIALTSVSYSENAASRRGERFSATTRGEASLMRIAEPAAFALRCRTGG